MTLPAIWRQTASLCLLLAMLATGCAKKIDTEPTAAISIGPYTEFTGRLIVIEPARRWQTALDWKANSPEQGSLRLTHAATGTVVEFRWLNDAMEVRDNKNIGWRIINQTQLSQQGIVLPPQQLAAILLGNMPEHFKQYKKSSWQSRASGHLIRLEWRMESHRLIITDIKHGRRATLIVQP